MDDFFEEFQEFEELLSFLEGLIQNPKNLGFYSSMLLPIQSSHIKQNVQ